ncbi:MAG TPA: lipid-binding SYLF domain-containing protein [Humidesulfovibrio sp.]|uniref:lipid-binding SYLF domain-containing protein n=1 Tax=Humidesulfovibrio sp. TaxID=2910988 RepID=UPI002CED8EE4|nr:lipid-binding SYLF domain-containing protein [Humidesulfovibrio sp.]HWR03472.1 lipid-binding SYLF domain-containing protein [Humidesulfovibrio sp.]
MRRLPLLALCGLAALGTTTALSGCAGQSTTPRDPAQSGTMAESSRSMAASLLEQSARTLREMRTPRAAESLEAALASARAVIVLPGVYQAGFMYSIHAGSGVLVARRADGGWGAPVFMTVGGVGYGPQVGLEKSRLVLVIMEEEMLERILAQGLTFDAAVKYDVLGVREESGLGTLTEGRPVVAFADGAGVMAGVALRGGLLTVDRGLTLAYYADRRAAKAGTPEPGTSGVGTSGLEIQEIMRGAAAPSVETFAFWAALGVAPQKQGHAEGGIIRYAKP